MTIRYPRVLFFAVTAFLWSVVGHTQLPSGEAGPSFGEVNPEQIARMMNPEQDGPFYMINLIEFRENAVYADGRETDLTGQQANSLYTPIGILREIGARPVFVAQVEKTRSGEATNWDQVAIVRYPSRRAFLQMIQRPDFRAKSIHKSAGVERSIVMVSEPIELPTSEGSAPSEAKHPATAGDPPVEMVHLFRYREEAEYGEGSAEPAVSGREAMAKYDAAVGSFGETTGGHPTAWFRIEGVYVGDGRPWDEVRIQRFPSHDAWEAHLAQESRLAAEHHRNAAFEDSYSLLTLPAIHLLRLD